MLKWSMYLHVAKKAILTVKMNHVSSLTWCQEPAGKLSGPSVQSIAATKQRAGPCSALLPVSSSRALAQPMRDSSYQWAQDPWALPGRIHHTWNSQFPPKDYLFIRTLSNSTLSLIKECSLPLFLGHACCFPTACLSQIAIFYYYK